MVPCLYTVSRRFLFPVESCLFMLIPSIFMVPYMTPSFGYSWIFLIRPCSCKKNKCSRISLKSLQFKTNLPHKMARLDLHERFKVKWGASSQWSFDPNSALGNIGTTTLGERHSTLQKFDMNDMVSRWCWWLYDGDRFKMLVA